MLGEVWVAGGGALVSELRFREKVGLPASFQDAEGWFDFPGVETPGFVPASFQLGRLVWYYYFED